VKQNLYSALSELKRNASERSSIGSEGGDEVLAPAVVHLKVGTREEWIDDKLDENLPSLPQSRKVSNAKRERPPATQKWLNGYWEGQKKKTMSIGSFDSFIMMDNVSGGNKTDWHQRRLSKAKLRRRTRTPSYSSEEIDTQKLSSKYFLNMMESGDHMATTFFFLGAEMKMIKTIKSVMMDVSPKLKELVQANDTVELRDLTPEGFESMLQFIYCGECSWSKESVIPTIACASKLALESLNNACVDWIETRLLPGDAGKILDDCEVFSKVLGEIKKQTLKKKAWDIALSDVGKEVEALGSIFIAHDEEWIKNVILGNNLICKEETLFDAIAEWACHRANRKYHGSRKISPRDWHILTVDDEKSSPNITKLKAEVCRLLSGMIPLMRLPTMSQNYLATNGLIASLLNANDIIDILRHKHDARGRRTRFNNTPRYATEEVSREGCPSQSSEHFVVLQSSARPSADQATHPKKVSVVTVRILRAELALQKVVFDSGRYCRVSEDLDVAQTKHDFQPWWDIDLGRLCRIQKIQILLGKPCKSRANLNKEVSGDNDMFPLALCLARETFPDGEGSLSEAVQMAVMTKYFETPPAGSPTRLEWEPALAAARTFRLQCAKATSLRIMSVKIFSAEPVINIAQ